MLKNLLYLYNDGHNPFPKLGKGGLGYHIPEFKLRGNGGLGYHLPEHRLVGRALHYYKHSDGTTELIDDLNYEDPSIYTDGRPIPNITVPETKKEDDLYDEIIEREEEIKSKKNKSKQVEKEGNKMIKEIEKYLDEIDEAIPKSVSKSVPEQSATSVSDIEKIRERLSNRFKSKSILNKTIDALLTNYPYITFDEFIKDMDGYIKGTKKVISQETKLKKEERALTEAVNKTFKKGNDENKGTAFEKTMIDTDIGNGQDILKEFSKSDDDFVLCADNPIYNNEKGNPIMIKFKGDKVPLSMITLYDLSNKKSITDCKYYLDQDYTSIQLSKLEGSPSFTPCWVYNEKKDKYTLHNIWCNETNSWTEPDDKKEVNITSKLNDNNVYNFSITNLINSWKKLDDNTNGCPMKQVIINGKETQYYYPDANKMLSQMDKRIYKRNEGDYSKWFDLSKDEMVISKTKYVSKKIVKKNSLKK